MGDEGLLEAGLVSGQALLLQRVYELELVNLKVPHEAGHELLQEFLEACEVLSNERRALYELHELLVGRVDVLSKCGIDGTLSTCRLSVE